MPQNIEKSSPQMMEIKSSYGQPLVKKEVTRSPLGSPNLVLGEGGEPSGMTTINTIPDSSLQHNIIQGIEGGPHSVKMMSFEEKLKQQQQFQQEFLLRQYRQQQQQLAEEHEKQLQLHIKYLEQQTQKAEEERAERQRLEEEKIEAIKKKEKHEHSAVASNEVKQRLQDKILKKLRDGEQCSSSGGPPNLIQWQNSTNYVRSLDKGSPPHSLSYGFTPTSSSICCSSHPYRPPGHILPAPEDFPLRKTASEPNICLKVKLKQRVIDRRSSPIVRRKDRFAGPARRRPLTHVDSASTPDSGQSSPPNGLPNSRSSAGSTPIHEEGDGSPYGAAGQGSCSDLSHPFSSLPNISLGRPPHSNQSEGSKLAMVSETEMVTAARAGMPITGHVLPSTLPNYPALPVIDSEGIGSSLSSRTPLVIAAMDTSGGPSSLLGAVYQIGSVAPPLSEAQQARLNRSLQRPLGRTQSAPLPLGHPMLQGAPPTFLPHGSSSHQFELKHELHPSNIIKQHIRQAVLKRSGSKTHVENVEEETEAAVAQAIGSEKSPEEDSTETLQEEDSEMFFQVIDLTDRKMEDVDGLRHHWEGASLVYSHDRLGGHYQLHHHRDIQSLKPPPLYSTSSPYSPRSGSHIARPLSRALSSPLVTLSSTGTHQEPININKQGATTGLAYDSLMQKHQCICGINELHPEHGGRIQAIWNRLQDTGLVHRCHRISSRKATLEEIQSCHSEAHTVFFGTNPITRQHFDFQKLGEIPIKNFVKLHCGGIGIDSDTTWNELHTASAARMAVGCAIELAFKISTSELRNGYAIVRPPGHHAEYQQAMGFCFFNTIAITAKQLQQQLNLDKILILDWDVHHGNGTQSMFYEDPHILYMSMHRYDDGTFFPGTGAPTEVGEGDGFGFNVNISWSGGLNPPLGDAEYLAAFRSVVLPIAKDFNPDIILVSAGFDAAESHPAPLGGYKVSSSCFAYMTKSLMNLARGKVLLVLEGGYEIESICDASQSCLAALLGDEIMPISEREMNRRPCRNAIDTLQNVIACQLNHWPVVHRTSGLICLSYLEAKGREEEQETVSAMASLRVDHQGSHNPSPEPIPNPPLSDEEEPMDQDIDTK